MHILVTNDDGVRSPLLPALVDSLQALGNVTVVVPAEQQSWRGKALTRYGEVLHEERDLGGHRVQVLNGTPADCVNVGLGYFVKERPAVVVSGINLGLNAGSSFVFSSGTIGAAIEGNLFGVPAVAFSQELTKEAFSRYHESGLLPDEVQERLTESHTVHAARIVASLMAAPTHLAPSITWNVNFPFTVGLGTEVAVCPVARTSYGSYFARAESIFTHSFHGLTYDESERGDIQLLKGGSITLSKLDLHEFGRVSPEEQAQLETRLSKMGPNR